MTETPQEELKRLEARLKVINVDSPGRRRLEERIAELKRQDTALNASQSGPNSETYQRVDQ